VTKAIIAAMLVWASLWAAEAAEFPTAETFVRAFCPTDDAGCQYNLETFPDDYAGAIAGDYQGQRNVAFCLRTGCDGAVFERPTLACAWRKVILASGHPEIITTDIEHHHFDCGQLDRIAHDVAVNQARVIFGMLTAERPMAFPPALLFPPN